MSRSLIHFAALLCLLGAAPVHATPTAALEARSSVTAIHHYGGFAIVGSSGDDGSTTPVTSLAPATLSLANSHQHAGSYLYWDVEYTQTWALTQSWAVDPAAHTISASGSTHLVNTGSVVGPNCTPCLPTLQIDSTNTQALDFSLSETTTYSFHSVTTADEWVDLLRWVPASQGWTTVWYGAPTNEGRSWDSSGTLQAGLYRLRNNPYAQRADSGHLVQDSSWSYTMTLPDAVLTPVPEPAAWMMLVAGAAWLGLRRRRN